MPKSGDLSSMGMAKGQSYHGFTITRTEPLPKIGGMAVELRHAKSGARMIHLGNDDAENLFAVAFRTPPPDNTGLPHILEHSVLCGSRRYPVKDPFVELLKTSLATFLNAFTYPDRTVYPCSSLNGKDYRNLMRVYCDAVFFPLLSRDHFRQEGHHLEFLPDGKPIIKGVVYNEMRGVYSDPEGILDRHIQRILFSSNAYGNDYGGDPEKIPELTYEQYLNFHRTYYHPSNAWLFTYGNAELLDTLELLDSEYLASFDAQKMDTSIAPLDRWTEPRQAVFPYPLDADDSEENKTDVALAYAANDLREPVTTLAMKVIDLYLLDNAASPLRKALIDSKLGEELGGSGYASHQRDTYFIVDLKGSEKDRAEAVEKLILDVIASECANGFDQEKVQAALRHIELAAREIKPQYPLRLMERVFGSWLYDSDPLQTIQIEEQLDALRQAMADDPRFLEKTASRYLVENPHRLRITLVPDKSYIERSDTALAGILTAQVAELSEQQRAEVVQAAKRLETMQSEGNSPDALATLPRLAKSDVSPTPLPLIYQDEKVGGGDFLQVNMPSGGISYLNMVLDVTALASEDIDYLPMYCEALSKSGADGLDYAQMAERESSCTGGLEFGAGLITTVHGPEQAGIKLNIYLKALDSDWERALDVLRQRLLAADFGDRDRLRDILLQSRMAWRNIIVPSGNAYAALYASSGLTRPAGLAERLVGCTQARFVDTLTDDMDKSLDFLPERFERLRRRIAGGAFVSASCLGGDAIRDITKTWFHELAASFTGSKERRDLPQPPTRATHTGLAAPADVAFNALAMPAPALTDPDAPALSLLAMQLSYGYLWNEIRVKGGAYGARANFDGSRGVFTLSTFRDPNVSCSYNAFFGVPAFIDSVMDLSPAGMEQAVIGSIKTLDQPVRPATAVIAALTRYLGGETEEFRQQFRSRLLSLDGEAVRRAAQKLFVNMRQAPACTLSSRERISEENANLDIPMKIESLW